MKDPRIRIAVLLALSLGGTLAIPPQSQAAVVIGQFFNPGTDVPDSGTITDTQTLQLELSNISDISVTLSISGRGDNGGYNGELVATLDFAGKQAVLLNRVGRSTSDPVNLSGYSDSGGFLGVSFADSALDDIHTYQDTYGVPNPGDPVSFAAFQPDGRLTSDAGPDGVDINTPRNGMLSQFLGESAAGAWSLAIQDTTSADTLHRLDSWGIVAIGETGTGISVFTDGTLIATVDGCETFHNQVTFLGTTHFQNADKLTFAGPVTLAADTTLDVAFAPVHLKGNLTEVTAGTKLTKLGFGDLVLEASSVASHTGRTKVEEGTLVVDGQITSSHTYVEYYGALAGNGTVAKVTLNGGVLAPGNPDNNAAIGKLTSGDQKWNAGSLIDLELNNATGVAGTGWDLVAIVGTLTLCGDSSNPTYIGWSTADICGCPLLAQNFDPNQNRSWTIVTTTGGIIGFHANEFVVDTTYFQNDTPNGQWALVNTDPNTLAITYTVVPEPASVAGAIGAVLLGWGLLRRIRRTNA
ncbi:MAG TPA: proprotein convertase P-domain-containing protein [Candidatus Limnocylindria bacterium]|nr:proprotein convertase P-domain-containing protein [Candidatus Limnocylindria bacterium]